MMEIRTDGNEVTIGLDQESSGEKAKDDALLIVKASIKCMKEILDEDNYQKYINELLHMIEAEAEIPKDRARIHYSIDRKALQEQIRQVLKARWQNGHDGSAPDEW